MANNYIQFSKLIPIKNQEERDWLQKKFQEEDDNDEGPICDWEFLEDDFWIYAEEYADFEALADTLQEFFKEFRDDGDSLIITWAEFCSKLRPDEFTGGGICITKDRYYWSNPLADLTEQMEKKDSDV